MIARGHASGRAEGEQRGLLEGLRTAITATLSSRGVKLSETGRARLASCADAAVLTRWAGRARTVSSEAEFFAGAEAP